MAQIHRGKYDPRRALRRTRLLLILCLPLACLTLALTVLLGMQGWERLLALAESWRQSFLAWAAPPQARADFAAEGLAGLWSVVEGALNAAGWCLYGLTAALPWLLGLGLTALLIGLCTCGFSTAGVKIGNIFGGRFEKKAQIAGGVILILLGAKILLEHLGVIA